MSVERSASRRALFPPLLSSRPKKKRLDQRNCLKDVPGVRTITPMDDIILGPDVFVNASVALGSPPEHVIRRVLRPDVKTKSTKWILDRIEAMLSGIDAFKPDAVKGQMSTIRQFVEVCEDSAEHAADAWVDALVAAAKACSVTRVVTDHPDLADKTEVDGVEFLSSDAWLVEQTTPPPPPGA